MYSAVVKMSRDNDVTSRDVRARKVVLRESRLNLVESLAVGLYRSDSP